MTPARPAIERVLARCERSSDGCLLWTGYVDDDGYARVSVRAEGGWRNEYAHRVVYEHHHGPIPEGHEVDHVRERGCTHRHCQEWTHLEAVLPLENWRRSAAIDALRKTHVERVARTHCKRSGHPMTPENTYVNTQGARVCRTCKNEREMYRKRALRRTSPGSL